MGVPGAVKLALAGCICGGIVRIWRKYGQFLIDIKDRWASLLPAIRAPRPVLWIFAALFLLGLPLFLNRYAIDIAIIAGIYIVLALGLNIVVGLAGLLALGYIAFYAVGAYSYALLSTHYNLSFWVAMPAGGLLAATFGIVLGAPALRLRGDYLAIVTLGFGEITRIILNNWDHLTGGPNGIMGIGRPEAFGYKFITPLSYYYLVTGLVGITAFTAGRLNESRIGRAWVAIREDEVAAEAMGIDTTGMKLLAFSFGAAIAGIAGVFYAAKMSFVSPESFTFLESIIILCMVVLGGIGSIPGVILGAIVLVVLPESLRELRDYRMLIFGVSMVLMMVFRPQGLLGGASRRREMEPPDDRTLEHETESIFDLKNGEPV